MLDSSEFARTLGLQHFFEAFDVGIGDLGLHRAVLGSAHRAELSLLVDIGEQGFIVIFLSPLRIQGQLKLLIPVEVVTGTAELIVTITAQVR